MRNRSLVVYFVAALMSIVLSHTAADAGTVSITNNFAHDIRVHIDAGVSGADVTVYRGDPPRTYSTFIDKSISRITVVNLDGGANAELGSRTIANPSAVTNYSVMVDSNGTVSITVPAMKLF